MQKSSKNVLLIVVAAIVALVAYRLLFPAPLSDDQQIRNAFDSAVTAAQAKDVPGITQILSGHFVDADGYLTPDRIRVLLSRNIHDVDKITVTTSSMTITVHGDTAHTDCYVTVDADQGGTQAFSYHGEVGMDWAKEPDTKFLVIPTKTWKVVKSDVSFEGD